MSNEINKKIVTITEWNDMSTSLAKVDMSKLNQVIEDGKVTESEMTYVLDKNGDGKVTHVDFSYYDAGAFRQIGNILRKHNFKIYDDLWRVKASWLIYDESYVQGVPSHFWKDETFVMSAVKEKGFALKYADISFKKDKTIVLEAVKHHGMSLQYADVSFRSDKDVVLEAVKNTGHAIQLADQTLKNNWNIALAAVRQRKCPKQAKRTTERVRDILGCGQIVQHVGDTLKNDKTFILKVVKHDGWSLKNLEHFKDDYDVVLAAVKNDGFALLHASEKLKATKEIALEAIKQDGRTLKFADASLQNDKDVVFAAVKNDSSALYHASTRLKSDREVVLAAVSFSGYALQHADPTLQNDKKIVLTAVENTGSVIQYASPALRDDKDVALAAVRNDSQALKHVGPVMKDDKDVVFAAIREGYGSSFEYAGSKLKSDKDFVFKIIKKDALAFLHGDISLRKDKDFIMKALKDGTDIFNYADPSVKEDIGFATEVVVFSWLSIHEPPHSTPWSDSARNSTWQNVAKNKIGLNQFFSDDELRTPTSFKEALNRKYNISNTMNFRSLETLKAVLTNRAIPTNDIDNGKSCIIIVPEASWYGHNLHESADKVVDRMVDLGYRVMYYEAGNEMQVRQSLESASQSGRSPADVVMFAGDGDSDQIEVGKDTLSKKMSEEHYLDTTDFIGNSAIHLNKYVKDTGDVIINTESRGREIKTGNNLANFIRNTLPKTIKVHYSNERNGIADIEINDKGRPDILFYIR